MASANKGTKALKENDESSVTINPSMSSEDMENNQGLVNVKDSPRPKKKKSKKKHTKPTKKVGHDLAPKRSSQSSTQEPPTKIKNEDDPTALLDTKDASNDDKRSKQPGKWYLAPLELDIENRRQEMERFVSGAQLESLMQRGRRSRLGQLEPGDNFFNEEFGEYRSVDVVIPCPDSDRPPLGNALLNYVATLNTNVFAALQGPNQKSFSVDCLVAALELLGSKFVAPSLPADGSNKKKGFRPLSYQVVQDVVSQALRGKTDVIIPTLEACPEDTPMTASRQVFKSALNKNLASRRHSIERFLVDTDLKRLMKTYRPSALKGDKMWGKVFQSVRPIDVLLPQNSRSQLGNALLSDVAHRNHEAYFSLSSLQDRQIAVESLCAAFESFGTRFLEALPNQEKRSKPNEGPWRVVSYRTLFEKITKFFRTSSPRQAQNSLSNGALPRNECVLDSGMLSPKTRAITRRGEEVAPIEAQVSRKNLSTTFVGVGNNAKAVFGAFSLPLQKKRVLKRAFSEVEAIYQKSSLKTAKRTVLAPRPVFFE